MVCSRQGRLHFLLEIQDWGKSPLFYQAALCVGAGIPFLGLSVRQGPVLMFDFENGIGVSEELIARLAEHLGLSNVPDNLLVWNGNDSASRFGQPCCGVRDIIREWSKVDPSKVKAEPVRASLEVRRHLRTFLRHSTKRVCAVAGIRRRDSERVLRNSGASWAMVCEETELSKGTARRALYNLPKNHSTMAGEVEPFVAPPVVPLWTLGCRSMPLHTAAI